MLAGSFPVGGHGRLRQRGQHTEQCAGRLEILITHLPSPLHPPADYSGWPDRLEGNVHKVWAGPIGGSVLVRARVSLREQMLLHLVTVDVQVT